MNNLSFLVLNIQSFSTFPLKIQVNTLTLILLHEIHLLWEFFTGLSTRDSSIFSLLTQAHQHKMFPKWKERNLVFRILQTDYNLCDTSNPAEHIGIPGGSVECSTGYGGLTTRYKPREHTFIYELPGQHSVLIHTHLIRALENTEEFNY